ncbi:MAG: gamma carbonic anhydrase family protein [Candidatus Brocadiae bacterium]|nr:gamma carbonic anhydrase family protein [Candidatus Brocadiia bacterium]
MSVTVLSYRGKWPRIHPGVFAADGVRVVGDVEIGEGASLWFNVVVRGDVHWIRIGARTNIQDGAVIHVTHDTNPTVVGDDVTVGHMALLHGCTIGNRVLVGMGAVVMDRAVIGDECVVAARALVTEGFQAPPGSLVMGAPAVVKRALSAEERRMGLAGAENYLGYVKSYVAECAAQGLPRDRFFPFR